MVKQLRHIGEIENGNEDQLALYESFEQQTIQEIVLKQDTSVLPTWVNHPPPNVLSDRDVMMKLIELKQTEIKATADLKQTEIKANADLKRAEMERDTAELHLRTAQEQTKRTEKEKEIKCVEKEPDLIRANLERRRYEEQQQRPSTAEKQPNKELKRPAGDAIDALWIESHTRQYHYSKQQVSLSVWERTKSKMSDIRDVYDRVVQYFKTRMDRIDVRFEIVPIRGAKETINVVFAQVNGEREGWMDQIAAYVVGDDAPVARTDRYPSIPMRKNGSKDLVSAVVDPLSFASASDQAEAIERLDTLFVGPTKPLWKVLWCERPMAAGVIPTFIDVERDPIVAQLREWLVDPDHRRAAPTYPAAGVVDGRAPESVPPELDRLPEPLNIAEIFARCGLGGVFRSFQSNYERGLRTASVTAVHAPCHERIRQFRRITDAQPDVTFKQLTECLGWDVGMGMDSGVTKKITDHLLRHRSVNPVADTDAWCVSRGGVLRWKWRVCLPEMRIACIYVQRIRSGGVDMQRVSNALQTH